MDIALFLSLYHIHPNLIGNIVISLIFVFDSNKYKSTQYDDINIHFFFKTPKFFFFWKIKINFYYYYFMVFPVKLLIIYYFLIFQHILQATVMGVDTIHDL